MARNKVMKLWTAIVTAFLALCTALGFVTTNAAAALPQTETARNSNSGSADAMQPVRIPAKSRWSWSLARALPPTMKQRIRAEAHGSSPSCRHRPLTDATAAEPALTPCVSPGTPPTEPRAPLVPLQR
ncbi:DUF6344 domain-containing protein [Streptomyces sp. TRM68367]|uniref:DUF6344 domain-containing protein n=1 Tax=Streptomyces sp. TRM68367 TaxID=2758415 RepID=UPI00165C89AD|nr:DUF6344 domain-containing protein [Streptomyces sp. TRM68367]MBC9726419.1 hypothetical protein [Streptomyces sp. TRM68367]